MRLAFIAPLALAAAVGLASPAAACSLDAATGPIGDAIAGIGNALGLTGSKPTNTTTTTSNCTTCTTCGGGGGSTPAASGGASGSGSCANGAGGGVNGAGTTAAGTTITNNFITNNFITNETGEGGAQAAAGAGGAAAGAAGQAAPFTFPATSGGGGGGGGTGGGGFGGFSGSGNAISGTPVNPSSDLGPILAGGGMSGGGGGGGVSGGSNEPMIVASGGSADASGYPQFASLAALGGDGAAVTPGVSVAALPPAAQAGGNDEPFVGMASPKSGEVEIASGSGFGLEGTPASGSRMPSSNGTFMLAGLIGVAAVGAGWAWKAVAL